MDTIKITDLEVYAYHGVLKEENSLGQKFLISAEISADLSDASREDDITKSINYASVCSSIDKFLRANTYKLIETAADKLALHLLKTYGRMERIRLEIKKPWAPVLMPIETVSVVIERGWNNAYLSIGSNMGDKESNLREAIRLLDEDEECKVIRTSSFRITKPWGYTEQEDFLNGALYIETLRTPMELLTLIESMEKALKRERLIHWGPRTIDVDILLYDNEIIQTKELTIPHPEMQNREFVLEPLSEIAPWIMHPVFKETVYQLRKKLNSPEKED